MSTKEERTVGGFVFGTDADAELARVDEEKIAYLESRIDYTKLANVQAIYNKAVENRIFETPVGYSYLLNIYYMLKEQGAENVEPINLNVPLPPVKEQKPQKKIEPSRVKVIKAKFMISLMANLILAVIVIAMFVITIKGNNPNILNYEKAVLNKYAAWEEELTERENAIKEKERNMLQTAP